MIRTALAYLCILLVVRSAAQENLPTDYLSKDFHAARREAFRKLMPANSVAIIFAYPEKVFSRDINYAFHQNPDLYYLSGYKEPGAVLLIFKENQQKGDTSYNELFFARKRNPQQESWTGRRLGVEGVKEKLGFKQVYNAEDFKNYPLAFNDFSALLYDFFSDEANPLVQVFRTKANLAQTENKNLAQVFSAIENQLTPANVAMYAGRIKNRLSESDDSVYKTNPLLLELINRPDSATLSVVKAVIKSHPSPSATYNRTISLLREVKTAEELALLRKSVFLSAIAHREVMKAIRPDMSETELEGIFLYIHKKYGAEDEGYPPIVGAGANGCILHYIENNATIVSNQLVLMDVASEYHGYSADVTRTVPANGKFTTEQKAIYQLVYDAQEAVFKLCKEGTPFGSLNEKATEVLADGLVGLGIIADKKEVGKYYTHGCSHHMGLDVHDKNATPILKENMVITVEPGIYIPANSACDKKWWNIAVRIEDDVVIGKNGCENLSEAAPRSVADVEKAVAEKSVFDQLALPPLK